MINPDTHYWSIGGSATDGYSGASNTLVPIADPDYVAFQTGVGDAIAIASEAELAAVLQAYGSRLPSWLLDTLLFIQPTATTYTHAQLAAYSADARYRHAGGGVIITSLGGSVPFLTDPTSRNTVNSAYQYAQANPAHITNWKMSDGSFKSLSNTQMATLNNDMTTFVQSCFTCEGSNLTAINGGTMTTLTAIDAAYAGVSNVFP